MLSCVARAVMPVFLLLLRREGTPSTCVDSAALIRDSDQALKALARVVLSSNQLEIDIPNVLVVFARRNSEMRQDQAW